MAQIKGKPVEIGGGNNVPTTPYSSPRERFQSLSANIRLHQDMVGSAAFDRGADAALAEYLSNISVQASAPHGAMAVGYKLRGAVDFLRELRGLAEITPRPPERKDHDNLQPSNQPRRP